MRYVLIGGVVGFVTGVVYAALRPSPPVQPTSPTLTETPPLIPVHPVVCPPTGTRVLLIGDSFAEGLGPQLKPIATGCGSGFYADFKRGSHATDWQRESWIGPAILGSAGANVALISLGGNDFQGSSVELGPAIAKIVSRLRAVGMRVFWVAPLALPYEDKAGVVRMWQRAVGEDWFDSSSVDVPRAGDNIHAYPSGYKLWAERIWPWMSGKLGASPV